MSQVVPNQPLRLGPNDTNQLVSIEVADVPNDTGPLRAALHDTEPEVRLAALRAFARTAALDRDAVRSAVQYAVNDADPSVQSAAHEILAHVTAMENATNDFDLLTIGNNAAVSETPADSVP